MKTAKWEQVPGVNKKALLAAIGQRNGEQAREL